MRSGKSLIVKNPRLRDFLGVSPSSGIHRLVTYWIHKQVQRLIYFGMIWKCSLWEKLYGFVSGGFLS